MSIFSQVELDVVPSLVHGSKQQLDEAFTGQMAGAKNMERNRSLLRTLRASELRAEEAPNDWLVRRGFDVHFHTHLETTGEGKLVVMCFDEGYTIEQGEIRPCDASSTTLPA